MLDFHPAGFQPPAVTVAELYAPATGRAIKLAVSFPLN